MNQIIIRYDIYIQVPIYIIMITIGTSTYISNNEKTKDANPLLYEQA